MSKQQWTKVGTVMKRKDGNGTYLKIDLRRGKEELAELLLKSGMILNIQDPRKRAGITEEQLAKIPEYVKAELYLPPAKE